MHDHFPHGHTNAPTMAHAPHASCALAPMRAYATAGPLSGPSGGVAYTPAATHGGHPRVSGGMASGPTKEMEAALVSMSPGEAALMSSFCELDAGKISQVVQTLHAGKVSQVVQTFHANMCGDGGETLGLVFDSCDPKSWLECALDKFAPTLLGDGEGDVGNALEGSNNETPSGDWTLDTNMKTVVLGGPNIYLSESYSGADSDIGCVQTTVGGVDGMHCMRDFVTVDGKQSMPDPPYWELGKFMSGPLRGYQVGGYLDVDGNPGRSVVWADGKGGSLCSEIVQTTTGNTREWRCVPKQVEGAVP